MNDPDGTRAADPPEAFDPLAVKPSAAAPSAAAPSAAAPSAAVLEESRSAGARPSPSVSVSDTKSGSASGSASESVALTGVTKRYGALAAVDEVSFTLRRGEIAGFVGPNGAGKTTVLRMLATYLLPTAGVLRVEGIDVVRDPLATRRRIGYLPGDTPLYSEMRTDRFLTFVGRAHGLRGLALAGRLEWVIDACALREALPKRIKECSTGFRKRIGLAASLIHDPPVLLLDEPTHGLDPLQVLAFRDLLQALRPGRTILFSSHIISEVAAVSDRLLVIHEGRLLADGKLPDLCRAEQIPAGDLEALFVSLIRKAGSGARRAG